MYPPARIVVAEPDAERRTRLVRALAAEGITVAEAVDGRSLLRHIEHLAAVHGVRRPGLTLDTPGCAVLVNPQLPDISALDVVATVARAHWRIPMLMLDATSDPEVVTASLSLVRDESPPRLRLR